MNHVLYRLITLLTTLPLLLTGCSDSDSIPMVGVGIDDVYFIPRMQKLPLQSELTGNAYRWTVTSPDGTTREISRSRACVFLEAAEGKYEVRLTISGDDGTMEATTTVNVIHEDVEYSPYITRVYEYCPAPGQFVNTMPEYEDGDTYSTMLAKVESCIGGTADEMISLGGWGGYVTFGFDHTIISNPSAPELRLWGNAFYNEMADGTKGGSAEPGIIWVSFDENCNGIPDDTWYELAGSEFASTRRGYVLTYSRPEADASAVTWTDCDGLTGSQPHLPFHRNAYFPKWLDDNALTFTGSLLPDNASLYPGSSTEYFLRSFDWGYADNHPNSESALNSFDFANARDAVGMPVILPGVDFVRVCTGLRQINGAIGETSTELSRAADLRLLPTP